MKKIRTSDNTQEDPTEVNLSTGQLCPSPVLMTEPELINFLRIPEISNAKDYSYVIDNLKRMHDLPCIHICRKSLYPLASVLEWISQKCEKEKTR